MVNQAIESEFKRSSAENTQKILLDTVQVLLDSETFYDLPVVERSNMFNELRNIIDFKNKLNDHRPQRHSTDTGLPGHIGVQADQIQNESGAQGS